MVSENSHLTLIPKLDDALRYLNQSESFIPGKIQFDGSPFRGFTVKFLRQRTIIARSNSDNTPFKFLTGQSPQSTRNAEAEATLGRDTISNTVNVRITQQSITVSFQRYLSHFQWVELPFNS